MSWCNTVRKRLAIGENRNNANINHSGPAAIVMSKPPDEIATAVVSKVTHHQYS